MAVFAGVHAAVCAQLNRPQPSVTSLVLGFMVIYTIWGSTYLAIKHVVQTIPPYLAAGMRFIIAGLMLYPIVRWRSGHRPSGREWRGHALVGVMMLVVGNGLVCYAEQWVASGITALIIATSPMWFVLVDWVVYGGRRPNAAIALGMGAGMAGVFMLTRGPEVDGRLPLVAVGALLTACVGWAWGSVHAKRRPQPTPVLQGVAMQMLTGGAAQVVVGTVVGEWSRLNLDAVGTNSLLGLGYLIVVGSLVGFTTYVWLVQVASPAAVSTYAYVNPMMAVLLGWLIDGEPLGPSVLSAMAVILGAVVVITWVGRPPGERPGAKRTPARLAEEVQPEPIEP